MKDNQETNRVASKASRTALMAVIHRYNATKESKENFVGPDHLAYLFLPSKAKFFLSLAPFRRIFIKKDQEKVPGTYEYVSARTIFFDEVFYESLTQKNPQIVFLGAGHDTRAIWFQKLLKDNAIFELDAPTTQNEKKEKLKKNKIPLPESLVSVPINFNTDNLEETLLKSGYNPAKNTLFIWEGVTMYLDESAVIKTFSFIKHHSCDGSTLVFDYFYESVSELNEHFKFGIEEGKAQEFLAKAGIALINHYSPQEFEMTNSFEMSRQSLNFRLTEFRTLLNRNKLT